MIKGLVQIAIIGFDCTGEIMTVKQLSINPSAETDFLSVTNNVTAMLNDNSETVKIVAWRSKEFEIDNENIESVKFMLQDLLSDDSLVN